MEEVKEKNVDVPKEEISLAEIVSQYRLEDLKYQAAENHLVGNFDSEKEYKIIEIIYPELINLPKVITEITTDHYLATSTVNSIKLTFLIKIQNEENNRISASLNLFEPFVIAHVFSTNIITPIKTIYDINSPTFLRKIRENFHLRFKDEDSQELSEYISRPIELMSELVRKNNMLETYKSCSNALEVKYITDIFTELFSVAYGREIAKNFFKTVKEKELFEIKGGRAHILKQLLDVMLDEAISKKEMPKEQVEKITAIRKEYLTSLKTSIEEYKKAKETPVKAEEAPKKEEAKPKEEKKSAPKPASKPAPKKEEKKEAKKDAPKKEAPKKPAPKKENTPKTMPLFGAMPPEKPKETPKIEVNNEVPKRQKLTIDPPSAVVATKPTQDAFSVKTPDKELNL